MKLYINGRFLTQKITGVQRYAIEIVKCLDKIINEDDEVIILIPPEKQITFLELKKIKQKIIGGFKGHLWIQIVLPLYVWINNGELLTFSGTAPIVSPGYWTVHDITFIRHPESFNWKFRLVYYLTLKIGLNRSKKIFTVSEFSKKEISEYFNTSRNNIIVAYSSANYLLEKKDTKVDISRFGIKKKEYYLSVSSRNRHKNQVYIEKLSRKYSNIKFIIVGGISKSFNEVNAQNTHNLIYTGYIDDDTLVELYKNAKGFIFPSLYEGFGLPPLEAIIAGCDYIALSDIEVFRELYSDSAYFFNNNSVEEFSFTEFENKKVSKEVRECYIKKYSFENDANIYYEVIKQNSL